MLNNDQLFNKISAVADKNTAKSQEFAREEMKFNAQEAEKNRNWQAQQSATAHQREVADLQKAGLNPVLSAGGQGAQTGSGATASGAKGETDNSVVPALTSIIVNQQNAANQIRLAEINKQATLQAASIHAGASLQAARLQAEASRFGATTSANAMMYNSDQHFKGQKYSANMQHQSSKYAIDKQMASQKRGQNLTFVQSLIKSLVNILPF